MEPHKPQGLYGTPPRELADWPADAIQLSPLVPGATALESLSEQALSRLVMLAPGGALDRRYGLALGLRALVVGGELTVMAPKDKGGQRLAKELAAFGCTFTETARAHHRILIAERPAVIQGLEAAIELGELQMVEAIDLWSQPGIFGWDKVDAGSALLVQHLPALSGRGADFGCGFGFLARHVLAQPRVAGLTLVDIDRRAIEASRRNIDDARAHFLWADMRTAKLEGLDFIVTNPPFHDGGAEDRTLGLAFIRKAAESLRRGGVCYLVANRHLPYEEALTEAFSSVVPLTQEQGFKIYEARK